MSLNCGLEAAEYTPLKKHNQADSWWNIVVTSVTYLTVFISFVNQ